MRNIFLLPHQIQALSAFLDQIQNFILIIVITTAIKLQRDHYSMHAHCQLYLATTTVKLTI